MLSKHDSLAAYLMVSVDIPDDLQGTSSYFALGKICESFVVTFKFFFNEHRRHQKNQIFDFHVIFSAIAQEYCYLLTFSAVFLLFL